MVSLDWRGLVSGRVFNILEQYLLLMVQKLIYCIIVSVWYAYYIELEYYKLSFLFRYCIKGVQLQLQKEETSDIIKISQTVTPKAPQLTPFCQVRGLGETPITRPLQISTEGVALNTIVARWVCVKSTGVARGPVESPGVVTVAVGLSGNKGQLMMIGTMCVIMGCEDTSQVRYNIQKYEVIITLDTFIV